MTGLKSKDMYSGGRRSRLFFLICTNDLREINTRRRIFCFADNTALVYRESGRNEVIWKTNEDLAKIAAWFRENGLHLNARKIKFIHFGYRDSPIKKGTWCNHAE